MVIAALRMLWNCLRTSLARHNACSVVTAATSRSLHSAKVITLVRRRRARNARWMTVAAAIQRCKCALPLSADQEVVS